MKKKLWTLLAFTLLFAGGCKEELLEVKNENAYSDESYFKEAPQFNEAVVATYAVLLHQGMFSRDWYFIFDLMGNDAERDAPLLGDVAQFSNYGYGSTNQQIGHLWSALYRMIHRANLVLDKTGKWNPQTPGDQDKKKQYIAEAHFLRGLSYFYLVNLWGRVPLKMEYDVTGKNFYPTRAGADEVWQVVERDFAQAVEGLPLPDKTEKGRASQGAAIAMLGKTYLYQKKYADAAAQFEKLTKAPFSYRLIASYENQFLETNNTSPETIFDIPHKWLDATTSSYFYMFGGQEGGAGTKSTHSGRAQEYGWNDWRNVFISDASVNAFTYPLESGQTYTDPRAKLVFYGDAASGGDTDFCHTCPPYSGNAQNMPDYIKGFPNGGPYPYPFNKSNGYRWRKYQPYETLEKIGNPKSNINTQVIRHADVLLMLAESYIMRGNAEAALPLINQVRARVNATPYTSLGGQQNAMTILMRERRLELMGEQSRWFDLVRWGIAKQTLNAEKQLQINAQPFEDKHVLLPVPQAEQDTNPAVANDVAGEWN